MCEPKIVRQDFVRQFHDATQQSDYLRGELLRAEALTNFPES